MSSSSGGNIGATSTTSGAMLSSQVRVGVRVRPITAKEQGMGCTNVLSVAKAQQSITLSKRQFTYDAVFDATTTQEDLYHQIAPSLLQSFLDGYNATIMAYGQTGSGKTFTMGSEAHTELDIISTTGLIPRFMNDLFTELNNNASTEMSSKENEYQIDTSFLEVYGEDVYDLLDVSRVSLPLREDSTGGVICTGLTSKRVASAPEAVQVLHEGTLNRTTAATLMNMTSSRSHAVFTVTLTRHNVTSKLTFVDLAGSERMKKTGAEGERAREGIEINKGLLALGNVINALADDERLQNGGKKIHVPYRQSKLTRLLQDALGGNSQTLFLACVSAADTNASETLSTLHYANRARNIQNAPTRNIDRGNLEEQHWQSYATVLQAELLQLKFGSPSDPLSMSPTGIVNEELLKQSDVKEYLDKLQALAQQLISTDPHRLQVGPLMSPRKPQSFSASESTQPQQQQQLVSFQDANQSVLENFDPAMLEEVNPDEEMAILDQLLDLQQKDHEFQKEQQKDSIELSQVEGELVETEQLLHQLQKSLKVYHNMKAKYENLMVEVRQLELEKAQLAEQLENAKADPTLGCSRAIQKEMEMVERNLIRARNETRQHREMFKRAEQEAQKCKTLERKIAELKQGRATLIKKQKEAAAKHREMTDTKTREIMALKRKDRAAEQKMSKLQTEVQIHKRNLDIRQAYCKKLMEQKKQTETHLMKLLTMRQRDFRDRTNRRGTVTSHRRAEASTAVVTSNHAEQEFAPENEELASIMYCLDKETNATVTYADLKSEYEDRLAEYGESMRALVAAVKELESEPTALVERQELEHTIQELELKVELLASTVEQVRSRISRLDEANADGDDRGRSIKLLIRNKPAPVVRTILVRMMDKLADSELKCRQLTKQVRLKKDVIESFEMEVDSLNTNVGVLQKELVRSRALKEASRTDSSDASVLVQGENATLKLALEDSQQEALLLKLFAEDMTSTYEATRVLLAETSEKLSIATVAIAQREGFDAPDDVVQRLQEIWREMGQPMSARDEFRSQIDTCLTDTCTRKLQEAELLKANTIQEIAKLRDDIASMCLSLGIDPSRFAVDSTSPLLKQLDVLKLHHGEVKPMFLGAVARWEALVAKVTELCFALGLPRESLGSDLATLLNDAKDAADAPRTKPSMLSDAFLAQCDASISKLRMNKSTILSDNSKLQQEAHVLIVQMNLNETDVKKFVLQNVKRRLSTVPSWWKDETADAVTRSVMVEGGVVRSSRIFSQHMASFHEALSSFAQSRRLLSDKFRALIERTQKALLKTVDGELEANAAFSNFHDSLFGLPPLSKELIHACMAEIDVLITGVDAMSQSETEALTVVWEALNVDSVKRSQFWGRIDESLRKMETDSVGPFDELIGRSNVDVEDWLKEVIQEGTESFRKLETCLLRLETIHAEVEQLSARQDSKSRIITLDSEVLILSAKLNDFEDKKCNKLRLTTKKNTSSNLLKEERFRKQMQAKFTAKLDQLVALLKEWKASESVGFDQNLLSEEVRRLLKKSDRNEFMHLRTVEYKSASKRDAASLRSSGSDGSNSPPRKRPNLSIKVPPREPYVRETRTMKPSSSISSPKENAKHRTTGTNNNTNGEQLRSSKKANPLRATKRGGPPEVQPRDTKKRIPLAEAPITMKRPPDGKKRMTLAPFGAVLEQALSPYGSVDKENPNNAS